jgi:hypothetical protein
MRVSKKGDEGRLSSFLKDYCPGAIAVLYFFIDLALRNGRRERRLSASDRGGFCDEIDRL